MSGEGNPLKKMMDDAKAAQKILNDAENQEYLRLQKEAEDIAEDIANDAAGLLVEIIEYCCNRNAQVSYLESHKSIIITLDGFAIFRMGFELEIKKYQEKGRNANPPPAKEIMELRNLYLKEPIETERKIFVTQDRTVAIYVMRKLQNLLDESEITWKDDPNGNIQMEIPDIVSILTVKNTAKTIEYMNFSLKNERKMTYIQSMNENIEHVNLPKQEEQYSIVEEMKQNYIDEIYEIYQEIYDETKKQTQELKELETDTDCHEYSPWNEEDEESLVEYVKSKFLEHIALQGKEKENNLENIKIKLEDIERKRDLKKQFNGGKLVLDPIHDELYEDILEKLELAKRAKLIAQYDADPYIWIRVIQEYATGKKSMDISYRELSEIQSRDMDRFGRLDIESQLCMAKETIENERKQRTIPYESVYENGIHRPISINYNVHYGD